MNGIITEGLTGLFRGLFFGIAGVIVKPGVGMLQTLHRVSAAIRSTIDPTVKLKRHRVRPPRFFGPLPMMQLSVYSFADSFGEQVLARVDQGRYRADGYLMHIAIPAKQPPSTSMRYAYPNIWSDMVLLCTRNFLILAKESLESDKSSWVIPLSSIRRVEITSVQEHPLLEYWKVQIISQAVNYSTYSIICWTKELAKECCDFCNTASKTS
eukprot:CAMPEP_0184040934 /NCGR_PEP_ID=MMETSP0955-20130417/60359_1 /TAXON_ID=627963 /ORGANISM="Aplanochytrium sp, Strain PBS07" /LENGTH=210 /DNA_ID=CAMNT_0026330991 /DNA_START=45 /DNA_END=677 /DNA_ORIENTATION=-